MVIPLTTNKLTYYLPSGVVPDKAMVTSIKTRKTGKTQGERVLEPNIDGIVLALKHHGTDVDYEIPLQSILNQSTGGNCTGYVLAVPLNFNFGETGSELRAYDASAVTTGKVVELEVAFYLN
jgi:hypothetical protein